jgi:Skp family chaperone for outer membrane proteins
MRKSQQTSGFQRQKHRRTNERPGGHVCPPATSNGSAQPDLLSASQGAEFLGVSARSFRRYVTEGKITPHSKTPGGGHWRFLRRDLETFKAPAQASPVLRQKRERVEELSLELQEKKAELALQKLQDEEAEIQAQKEQAQQDAAASEARKEREVRQARAAARAQQARQDWEAEWVRNMLKTLPRDLPAQFRLDAIEILRQNLSELYDNHAGNAEDVVFTVLRAAVDEVLAPWIHSKAVARAAAEAIRELPTGATSSTWGQFSEWERRAREEALGAIADLPDGATFEQLVDAARTAGRQIAQAYNHQETADSVIAQTTWSLPRRLAFSTPQSRAQAAEAVRAAIAELPIGASRAEFEEACDAAVAPFAEADAGTRTEHEAQQASARRQIESARCQTEAQQAIARRETEAANHLQRVHTFLEEIQADPNGVDFEGKLYQYAKQIVEEIKPDLLEDLPLDFRAGRRRVEELVNEWVASHCS